MNTEELERSLRSEFDDQFKKAWMQTRADVDEFQRNLETAFEDHRAQLNEVFSALVSRLEIPREVESAFSETVVEHLRLARDEGARITATAMGEAEKLEQTNAAQPANYSKLRDAISNIKEQQTQAAILRTLVESASEFAPRGAFFIVKNDHLVGWKVFGSDKDEAFVRSIHFPLSSDTILSDSVNSLSTRVGNASSAGENSRFLEPLDFEPTSAMVAIPLAARGRGVAVLYADGGAENYLSNVEALETLVAVAGLTVELRAAATGQPVETAPQPKAVNEVHDEPVASEIEEVQSSSAADESESVQCEPVYGVVESVQSEPAYGEVEEVRNVPDGSEYAGAVAVTEESAPVEPSQEPVSTGFAFSTSNLSQSQQEVTVPALETVVKFEEQPVETVVVKSEIPQRRISDRSMDLPIEVSDDERRPHSDARRFARLLISEIKLYNEQKVTEGRESGEIYEVLKESIDRSREMYEKRVQPDVAAKFDYFHYELVNNLAQGDEEKLGVGYFAGKA